MGDGGDSSSGSDSDSSPSVASQYASYGEGRAAAESAAGYGMGTSPSVYSGYSGKLYDSDGTVYNTDGTTSYDANIVGTAADNMSGATFDAATGAPVVETAPAKGVAEAKTDVPRALLTLGSMLLSFLGLANPATAPGAALSLGRVFYNGDHTRMAKDFGFGSPAPRTAVTSGRGAAAAASYFSGEGGGQRSSSYSSNYGFGGSPVIGYQGAVVNPATSPALATANLGAKSATPIARGAGAATQPTSETPWGAIALAAVGIALLS
jgi:hypothetical protein